jgi:hypothetical protein
LITSLTVGRIWAVPRQRRTAVAPFVKPFLSATEGVRAYPFKTLRAGSEAVSEAGVLAQHAPARLQDFLFDSNFLFDD